MSTTVQVIYEAAKTIFVKNNTLNGNEYLSTVKVVIFVPV